MHAAPSLPTVRRGKPISRLLNIEKAANYCGVSATTFNAEIRPRVPPIEIGKRRVWDRVALDRWIDAQSGAGNKTGDEFNEWEKKQAQGF